MRSARFSVEVDLSNSSGYANSQTGNCPKGALTMDLESLPPIEVIVSAPIAGLIQSLPAPGTNWPDIEKAKFMSALGAVLDLVYPTADNVGDDEHG